MATGQKSGGDGPITAEPKKIERKIHFFKADRGVDADNHPIPLNIVPACELIDALEWGESRYYRNLDESRLCCWIDRAKTPSRIKLANSRQSAFPEVEKLGVLSGIPIAADAGLAEPTHIVCFPNGIVGVEANHYGPRGTRLPLYLADKAPLLCANIDLIPEWGKDVLDRLNHLGDLRLFRIKIRTAYISLLKEADEDLFKSVEAQASLSGAEYVEIVLRRDPREQKGLLRKMMAITKKLTGLNRTMDEASVFIVGGHDIETGRMSEIDILNEKMMAKRRFILKGGRSRSVDSDSAYKEIEAAYDSLKGKFSVPHIEFE